ncbi:thiol-disulfide oxidoreductase DCC family protein [Planococcus sp. N028]|uniref:Thiol-disulfide oxidoreductase DCC family protein n=1 Tax=Planococcus shixiaomingii TaxID=3058393 RepID=A0ABT8N5E2_9BACL|nr:MULTISPECIES: thiol-disulfide oxidoreductase DCC family protein [unclassified Planococcus (in: firmicutes)]MDN7243093.1 thiol-disulfide oxidoreductase DCC family protein [Planococcus sp. N028]WKA55040.1 thiol-disulfide oxidoreductase DCC family protein [Planococcus sp. N022]
MDHAIVLFDGDCNFCDSSVQFIIKHDPAGYYHFASLQSDVGRKLRKEHDISDDVDSLVLIENGQAYVKSEGALRISHHLTGLWKLAFYLKSVPRFLRDGAYDTFARNRYKVFGKLNSCMLPPPHIRKRFLDK